ncbi:uncharacterized protein LOC141488312 [Macrotis lagotis]|uniref:uncharacterized protein LOC141488312 n=1 Tax=Macrotis lagotis TaxID=92651 RepID=UPI003D682028
MSQEFKEVQGKAILSLGTWRKELETSLQWGKEKFGAYCLQLRWARPKGAAWGGAHRGGQPPKLAQSQGSRALPEGPARALPRVLGAPRGSPPTPEPGGGGGGGRVAPRAEAARKTGSCPAPPKAEPSAPRPARSPARPLRPQRLRAAPPPPGRPAPSRLRPARAGAAVAMLNPDWEERGGERDSRWKPGQMGRRHSGRPVGLGLGCGEPQASTRTPTNPAENLPGWLVGGLPARDLPRPIPAVLTWPRGPETLSPPRKGGAGVPPPPTAAVSGGGDTPDYTLPPTPSRGEQQSPRGRVAGARGPTAAPAPRRTTSSRRGQRPRPRPGAGPARPRGPLPRPPPFPSARSAGQ